MSFSFNRDKHPERRSDEVFLMNTDTAGFDEITWRTKRKGKESYWGDGTKYPFDHVFPVFVKKAEIAESRPDLLEKLQPR